MSQDQAHFKNKMNTKHQTTKDHTECIVDLFGATELLNKGQILSLAKTANTQLVHNIRPKAFGFETVSIHDPKETKQEARPRSSEFLQI
jgi:hypothetical protein